MVVPEKFIMTLGWAYIVCCDIYGICYLANLATLRSIIWFFSLLCPILLFVITVKMT